MPSRRDVLRLAGVLTGTAAMAPALGACSAFVGGSESDSTSLRAYLTPVQRDGLKSIVAAFEKAQDITFEGSYANAEEINQQLRVHLTSGTAADLFRVSPGYSSPVAARVLGESGDLADLSGAKWVSTVPESATALSQVDGKTMAFPVSRQAIANLYNKKVFQRVGVEPPTTWTELLAACKKFKAAGVTPIALGLAGGVAVQFTTYGLAACIVYSAQPDIDEKMAKKEVSFASSAEWKDVFEKFSQLIKLGYTTGNTLGVSGELASRSVATGEAAMITVVTGGITQLAEYAPGGLDDLGLFALPGTDDVAQTRVPIAPDFIAVNAKAKNGDLARDFIEFIAKPENVKTYAETLKVLPGIDGADVTTSPILEPLLSYLDGGKTVGYANYLWPNADVQQVLLQAGQQYFGGQITVDAFLKKMDEAYAKGTP